MKLTLRGVTKVCALACCLLTGTLAQAVDSDARSWLERMSKSLTERNYDGRFIHSRDDQSETLRIVHRNVKGKITERLVSFDGSRREYIRTNTEVTCYMPDTRSVLVESRPDSDALLSLIPEYRSGLEAYYDISVGPVVTILGRKAQVLTVQPRDEYRYGYRLWLDAETAMPLKSQLFSRNGRVIEQVAFAELTVRDRIADDDLRPAVDASGYQWVRHEIRRRTVAQESVGWRITNLPPGFKLQVTRLQPLVGSSVPVRHLVYTDGLATVSLFIEQVTGVAQGTGLQKVGSAFAFHSEAQGYQVTAVGEVPAVTVKSMVSSLIRDPGQSLSSAK